jgi:tubulin polyglutamylase TTLL5
VNHANRALRYWLGEKSDPEHTRFFVDALNARGWVAGDAEHWDTAWLTPMPEPRVYAQLGPDQRINHIPGNNQLTVKSALHQTLRAAAQRWRNLPGQDGTQAGPAFMPATFNMPDDFAALQTAARAMPDSAWIVKPANAARGEGIYLTDSVDRVPQQPGWVVQRYLDQPHTLDGVKYVLRLYVLISSLDPLRIERFAEGSVKLASAPYDPAERDNVYAVLTNPDVSARNPASSVTFLSLHTYAQRLRALGHDPAALMARLDDLIVQTVIAAVDGMRKRCVDEHVAPDRVYELLGLDCLIDSALKPWLLECNLSPSLEICADEATGGHEERVMKKALVDDLLVRVGITPEPSQASIRFKRLFPTAESSRYWPMLVSPSLADQPAAQRALGKDFSPVFAPWQVKEHYSERGLALEHTATGQVFNPNPTAAWIWLQAVAGMPADAIAKQLVVTAAAASTPTLAQAREDVWHALGEWARSGLLRQTPVNTRL